MAFDVHKNLIASTVKTGIGIGGLSLTVKTGDGAIFPSPPFNCTVWPAGSNPSLTNAEIVRVTNIAGDVLSILRQQEGSNSRSILGGDNIALTITAKSLQDIENTVQISRQNNDVVTFPLGTPLAISGSGLVRASAADNNRNASGLATLGAAPGFAEEMLVEGLLTLADWTAIIGAAALTPYAVYYLGVTQGILSTVAPTTVGQVAQRVGQAVTVQTMKIHIHQAILL